MKLLIALFTFFIASAQSSDLNLNDICHGILFEAIPHPNDRNLFIGCVQGRGTIFGCENFDDVFDPETVSCVDSNILSTTEEPLTTPEFNLCQGVENGYLEHSDDCSLFIFCRNSTAQVRNCEPGNIFDVSVPICRPGNSQTCEFYPSTTTLPPTTTTCSPGGDIGIQFVCPPDGTRMLIPSATSCDRYFDCILGVANMRFCATGLHFDVITRTCMDPELAFCAILIKCV